LAAIAIGKAPDTPCSEPSSASSPSVTNSARALAGICPSLAKSASAIGRSKPVPSLRTSAGARLTSSRPAGNMKPELTIAARARSFDSLIERSGNPMIVSDGVPAAAFVSTRTIRPSTPRIAHAKAHGSTAGICDERGNGKPRRPRVPSANASPHAAQHFTPGCG
jgi:hypothetical protein